MSENITNLSTEQMEIVIQKIILDMKEITKQPLEKQQIELLIFCMFEVFDKSFSNVIEVRQGVILAYEVLEMFLEELRGVLYEE